MISNEFLKGLLKTLVLQVLEVEGPMHGYWITKKVKEATNGQVNLTFTNIYPILHKLKKEKILVTASDITTGRMRVYYSLTPKGHSLVSQKIKELKGFIEILRGITELKPTETKP